MTPAGLVLRCIHALILVYQCVFQLFTNIGKSFKFPNKTPRLEDFVKDAKTLRKLPIHVGVVLVEDEVCLTDVAKIVVWCVATGITYITIYDRSGYCKQHKEQLEGKIEDQQCQSIGKSASKLEICVHKSRCTTNTPNGVHRAHRRADVTLLSMEDGRQTLVSTAKALSTAVARHQYSPENIAPPNVDAILQEKLGVPDPDLVLKFGCVESMLGYLPWQARLTEILSFPSHHHIDYKSFLSLLHSFGNTQQRFGK